MRAPQRHESTTGWLRLKPWGGLLFTYFDNPNNLFWARIFRGPQKPTKPGLFEHIADFEIAHDRRWLPRLTWAAQARAGITSGNILFWRRAWWFINYCQWDRSRSPYNKGIRVKPDMSRPVGGLTYWSVCLKPVTHVR